MLPAVVLLVAVLLYRVLLPLAGGGPTVLGLNNFSPMSALVLCGAAFLPRRWAVVLPLVALFVSDLLLNVHYGVAFLDWETVPGYLAFGLIAAFGWSLRGGAGGWRIFVASLASSLLFYVVTNTASWAFKPEYASGFAGWVQALTTGQPGHPPTWMFYRNTVVSDLVFTALFVLCLQYRPAAPAPQAAPVESAA